ncbi:uncharacterized protein LOC134706968 [Mytilus trossulus]|uniref:uncharacterized protein LOC134706968 n=1 Tax=Mytilus trossulus TaxID=6551 RepID=UPI003005FF69
MADVNNASYAPTILMKKEKLRPSRNLLAAVAGPVPKQPAVVAEPDAVAGPALQQLDVAAGPVQTDAKIEDKAVELTHLTVARPKKLKAKKRPLLDLIYENQLEYNKFITKKIPKLLKMLGVSSDSDSE